MFNRKATVLLATYVHLLVQGRDTSLAVLQKIQPAGHFRGFNVKYIANCKKWGGFW
ncbi:MAG TPA: hypothetical protein VEL11_14780 [Candidatus Bathyarchaeia archaeon]|nr:hypothetical protein [Candidatus Bathyarchaeia archaeon]